MLAREVMTSPVVTMSPDTPVKDAIQLLDRHEITATPVVDDDDKLVGIVSEADLLRDAVIPDLRGHAGPLQDPDRPIAATVADVMTRRVMAAHEGTDISDIAKLMLDTGVKSFPITRGSRVVGIVSRRDLIRTLATTDEQIQTTIQQLLTEGGFGALTATVTDGIVELSGSGSAQDVRIAMILARTVPGVVGVRSFEQHVPSQ